MLLLTAIFVPLLLLVALLNLRLPAHLRKWLLLAMSIGFIIYFSWQALILALFIAYVNFLFCQKAQQKTIFLAGISFNIALLFLSNYWISFGQGPDFKWVNFSFGAVALTLGLSFYCLQHIAYLVDCRNGKTSAEKDLCSFLVSSLFFPKFLSGPLTKHQEIIKQLGSPVNKGDLSTGINRMAMGIFKKMVLADRLAPMVHSVFDFGDQYCGLTVFAGALIFTLQLYFDFSAYTDLALGAARMMGFRLPENFNMPLRSLSVAEFWRKWHISLIRFFTEYIYYPLGFRLRKYRYLSAVVGIAATFLISGLWHGLGLTFFAWSLCHMIYLQTELLLGRHAWKETTFAKPLYWLITIAAVVFSNIFFRSTGIESISQNLNSFTRFLPDDLMSGLITPLARGGHQIDLFNFYVSIILATLFLLFERKINVQAQKEKLSFPYILSLVLLVLLFGVFANNEQFIYVQF